MRLYTLLFNILAVLLVSACSNKYMNKAENAIQKTDTAIQKTDTAIQKTDTAIQKTDTVLAKKFYNEGIQNEKNNLNDDALKSFDKAISNKAYYMNAWKAKIQLLHKMGRHQEANEAKKQMQEEVKKKAKHIKSHSKH